MSLSIADQLRNLGLASSPARFEPPGAYLKRLKRKRLTAVKAESEIRGPLPWEGSMIEIRRAAERRYLKFVQHPHSSPVWQEPRLTARGI